MSSVAVARPTSAFQSTTSHTRPSFASKKTMSVTQTYYLAHKARGKLSREAAQPDHNLRVLVGHANLLDSLMLELAEAEREQERWFNQSVRGASPKKHTTVTAADKRHVQWADRIEETEEEFDSDSSSDSEFDDEEIVSSAPVIPKLAHEEAIMDDEDEEDFAQLELVRTPSHSNSPPELMDHDFEESSDDESAAMPPSPSDSVLELPAKSTDQALFDNEFYTPPRQASNGLVTSVMVY